MVNYETYIIQLEENMTVLRGEIYKFSHDKQKKSAKVSRKLLNNMAKIAKHLRKLIQDDVKKLPVLKLNMTPERKAEVTKKRLEAMAAARAKKALKNR